MLSRMPLLQVGCSCTSQMCNDAGRRQVQQQHALHMHSAHCGAVRLRAVCNTWPAQFTEQIVYGCRRLDVCAAQWGTWLEAKQLHY